MELRRLLYFRTVAEQLHFRKAAAKLFISQPPLSRQIREMENELGVLLFTRKDRRVTLTDAGKYFKAEVDAIFARLEESKGMVRQIHKSESGELKIGYISSVYQSHLADVLIAMRDVFPYIKTNLFEMPTLSQIAALEQGSGVCGIKIFAGSSTGDLLVEDDEHLERIARALLSAHNWEEVLATPSAN